MKRVLLLMSMVLSAAMLFAQQTYYVKPDGNDGNTGTGSWANAKKTIAAAVTVANGANGDRIFVKAGTYTATGANHIELTGAKSGLKFYGGFTGTDGEEPTDRTFADSTVLVARNAASSRVIYNNGTSGSKVTDVVYDGFTITGSSSSGMFNSYTDVTIKNCIFKNNATTGTGGAIYSNYTNLTVEDSKFYKNTASAAAGNGGGILFARTGTLSATNCIFDSNTASGTGYGGGIGIYAESALTNTANITNCTFTRNTSGGLGGGLGSYQYSTVEVVRSIFSGNTAGTTGGGVQNGWNTGDVSTKTYINCLFSGNKAVTGGGIYNANGAKPTLTNCTIAGNNATTDGGGIYSTGANAIPVITNCIIYGNSSGIVNASSASATITYSNVQYTGGNETDYSSGTGNLNADPLFSNSPAFGGAPFTTGNYTLGSNSANAVDKGLNSAINSYTTDITGIADRIYNGGTVDMGAYEYQGVLPVTVSTFTASLVNNRTQLKWSVGTESNVNRYEVERSQNGVDFAKVATVSANGATSYSATDANPQLGVNYYRLVSIDNDGTTATYKDIQTVKVASLTAQSVQVSPNPVKGNVIKVALNGYANGNYAYKLVNMAGVTVQQGNVNYVGSSVGITATVPAGVYMLYLSKGSNVIKTKLVKE